MITLNLIRKNLIDAIKNSRKTQKEVAEYLGVSQQTVSEYVHGKSLPALDSFAKLCEFLDEDPAEILGINKSSAK